MHRHQLTTFDQLRIAARLVDSDCDDEPALPQDIVRVDDARRLFVLGNEASRIQSGLEQLRVMMRHFDELTGPQRCAVSVWAVAQSVDSVRRAMRVSR